VKTRRLFVFGYGYSARALARRLAPEGWTVAASVRNPSDAAKLTADGVTAIPADDRGALVASLAETQAVLVTAPPDAGGCPGLNALVPALAQANAFPDWIGYLSTTGVYGDRQGGWVDESSTLTPTGERGRRRLAAEMAWRDLPLPAHLFRLAGIYGPGRSALDTVRSGKARRVVKPGQVFSRIHRDDIVQVLRASIARPNPGTAYNVCDDDAADPAEVITYACKLLDVAPPPPVAYAEAHLSPMARSFYDDNKRVRNDRIKQELGVVLKYPDYRAGLTALLAAES